MQEQKLTQNTKGDDTENISINSNSFNNQIHAYSLEDVSLSLDSSLYVENVRMANPIENILQETIEAVQNKTQIQNKMYTAVNKQMHYDENMDSCKPNFITVDEYDMRASIFAETKKMINFDSREFSILNTKKIETIEVDKKNALPKHEELKQVEVIKEVSPIVNEVKVDKISSKIKKSKIVDSNNVEEDASAYWAMHFKNVKTSRKLKPLVTHSVPLINLETEKDTLTESLIKTTENVKNRQEETVLNVDPIVKNELNSKSSSKKLVKLEKKKIKKQAKLLKQQDALASKKALLEDKKSSVSQSAHVNQSTGVASMSVKDILKSNKIDTKIYEPIKITKTRTTTTSKFAHIQKQPVVKIDPVLLKLENEENKNSQNVNEKKEYTKIITSISDAISATQSQIKSAQFTNEKPNVNIKEIEDKIDIVQSFVQEQKNKNARREDSLDPWILQKEIDIQNFENLLSDLKQQTKQQNFDVDIQKEILDNFSKKKF